MSWTDEIGNEDGKEECHVKNNKAKNGKKGKKKNKKTGIGPRSIMRTDRGRGRGNNRERNTRDQRRVQIESEETEPKHQDKIHEFSVKFNPYIMKKKGFSLQNVVEVVARTIDRKTGHTAIFHPTTKFPLLPKPIANISDNFPPTLTEIQDFFDVQEINPNNAEIHLALTMPGTTHEALHVSMKNTLKQYSLWLTSKGLAAKQQDLIGLIKNANPTYTDAQEQAKQIQEEITKMAEGNPAVEKQVAKIKGEQYIFCRPGKIYGNQPGVSGEGILIFTTSNNYGCVLYLLGILGENSISKYYQLITKIIKKNMNPVLYDKLILLH